MKTQHIQLGKQGEAFVAHYLTKQGFTICAQNYSIRQGEVDLIAQKDDILAFVEVKIRRTAYFPLSELVPRSKQEKIIKAALSYITRHKISDRAYRFDVALLEISATGGYTITYVENAFTSHSGAHALFH